MPDTSAPSGLRDRSLDFFLQQDQREHPWSRGETNVLRIAVIGDSFTAGAGVQADDRYADRLERLLNMKDGMPPAEVRVYAQCGTSTFQQIELLDEALTWKPHVVVLGICLNDMEDWSNPKELMRWREGLMPEVPPPWLAAALRRSRALNWLYARVGAAVAAREDLRYYRRLYKPSYSGVARFRDAIRIMNDKCREAHAAFVPMIWPLLSEPFDKGRYPFEYAHEAIRRRCMELDIRYLDLLPCFRGASPERLQVIPSVDPHPNEIAHRMASEALLKFLLSEGDVVRGYAPEQHIAGNIQHQIWEETVQRMHGVLPDDQPQPSNNDHRPVASVRGRR